MNGRDSLHTALHQSESPIDTCPSCQEITDPSDIGRDGTYAERVIDIGTWLRYELPDLWWTTDEIELVRVADWLLGLRRAVEEGRWKR